MSHINRGDFQVNITIPWQWYLLSNYKNIIIQPHFFSNLKKFHEIIWYVFEIEARQRYYLKIFKNKLNFIETTLEEITNINGAKKFFSNIGLKIDHPKMPPKKNYNPNLINEKLNQEVNEIFSSIDINVDEIVDQFIKTRKNL